MKIAPIAALALLVATQMLHARGNQPFTTQRGQVPKQELFLDPTEDQIKQAALARNIHCPVHGIALRDDSKNVDVIFKGRVIRLDCAACKPEFARNPEKYSNLAISDTVGQAGH